MVDENGLVSIIVPVYNAENYLHNCIASVLKQSYTYWELILVDDGSTDRSGDICDKFSKSNEKITVIHKENAGVSSARNTGIENAKGEYISFLDADDTLPVDSLEILMTNLIAYNADVAGGLTCGENWNKQSAVEIWQDEEGIINCLKDDSFTYSAWGKLYSRNTIGDTRFKNEIKINEDSLFVFQVMCKKPTFVCVNHEVYFYTSVSGSASRSAFSEKYFDILSVSEEKYVIIQQQFPSLLYLANNTIVKANLNLLTILAYRTNGEYRELEARLVRKIRDYRTCYVPSKKSDEKMFAIVIHGFFPLYKKGIRVKRLLKNLVHKF